MGLRILLRLFLALKQDRQCIYNVTFRRFRAIIVVVIRAISITYSECVCVCVCNLKHPAGNAHALFCHLWPDRLYNILFFLHYLINGMIFGKKKLLNIKCVFWLFVQPFFKIFLILRINERDMIINVNWSSCKIPVILVRV